MDGTFYYMSTGESICFSLSIIISGLRLPTYSSMNVQCLFVSCIDKNSNIIKNLDCPWLGKSWKRIDLHCCV